MRIMESFNGIYDAFVFWNPWWVGEKGWLKAFERDDFASVKQLFGRKEILTLSGVRRTAKRRCSIS